MKPCIYLMSFFVISVVANMDAVEPIFEIPISSDAVSIDDPNIPIIPLDDMVEGGVKNAKSSLRRDVEVAISSNDLASLSRMLQSGNVADQTHAAIALGKLTAHRSEAQELLASFIASKSELAGTEFGVDSINREIALAVAEESLEAIGSSSEPSSSPQNSRHHASSDPMSMPQAPTPKKSTEHKPDLPKPVQEPSSSTRWPWVAAVVVVALGLLSVLLKKRK